MQNSNYLIKNFENNLSILCFFQMEKELLRLASHLDDDGTRDLFSIGKTFEERDLWAFKVSLFLYPSFLEITCHFAN